MIINKKSYVLLLVALIATTPVQAAPMGTLNALLVCMQNNVIARQLMTKKAAALVGVTAAGIGLWWWLKNRQANPVQQGLQTQLTTQEKNVTIPWGVAQIQNVNGHYHAVKSGPRFDIFLVCEENHKPASNQELDLLQTLVHGYDDRSSGSRILPLVESIADKIDKKADIINALQSAFVEADQQLEKLFDLNNNGAKATVAVIDKETKEVAVATLGDIRAALLLSDKTLVTPSLKIANLDEDEKSRVHKTLDDFTCSRASREAKVKDIKNEMAKKKLLFGLPVTRVFGEFAAKKKISNVITAYPYINDSHITNEKDYLIIASDSVWQNIDAAKLRAIMQTPLSDSDRKDLINNLRKDDCAVNKLFSTGSQENRDAAKNIRDTAVLRAIRAGFPAPDVTAMVIDMRQLRSKEK